MLVGCDFKHRHTHTTAHHPDTIQQFPIYIYLFECAELYSYFISFGVLFCCCSCWYQRVNGVCDLTSCWQMNFPTIDWNFQSNRILCLSFTAALSLSCSSFFVTLICAQMLFIVITTYQQI